MIATRTARIAPTTIRCAIYTRNPARLGWKPIVMVEHYAIDARNILSAQEGG